jgi:hypothetical protein
MWRPNRPFRLTATVAVSAMLWAQVTPWPALAQAPPPPPPAGTPDQQTGDPPARVGRLASLTGTVSLHTQDDAQWSPAIANYPVTAGTSYWTQPNAQAVIEVSASRLVMAPSTELDVTALNDNALQVTEPQGEAYLGIPIATPDQTYAIQTPRGLVTFAAPGRYGIVAGDTQTPTSVTVIEGSAHVTGPGLNLDIGPNQTAAITGDQTFTGVVGPAQRDPFLTAILNSERPPPQPAVAPPPAVAAMPGGDDLAAYGSWSDSPDYGQVWYPQVAPDWAPYRQGQWAYVQPWGWTWVDSEPWGFAPFHYGRWAELRGRWCWVPGVAVGAPLPVYAPALVAFVGLGVGLGIGAALAGGRVGWVPLGPHEPYHPWYHASDRYFHQVNVTQGTNFTRVDRNVTINHFANRGAATVVPAGVMTGSRPVAHSFQRIAPAQLAQAKPVIGQQPLHPTSATVGVTPTVARQLRLPAASRPVAPGPAIRAAPTVVHPTAPGAALVHPREPPLHNPAGVEHGAPGPAIIAHPTTPAVVSPGLHPPATGPMVRPPGAIEPTHPTAPHTPPPAAVPHPVLPAQTPQPQVHGAPVPQPQVHVPPVPQPQVHVAPAPQPQVHVAPAPQPQVHVAPAPQPQVHVAPQPQFHSPAPAVHAAPAPQPQVHVAPPPQPQVHVAPPPQFHPPAPAVHAAPAPAFHPPPPAPHVAAPPPQPPPAPHPQPQNKRPGEP